MLTVRLDARALCVCPSQRTIDVVKDFNDTPADIRIAAVETLGFMASEVDFGDQQSSLLHAMCRVVVYDVQLRPSVVPVLLTLVRCMGRPFLELGHNHVVDNILKAHCTAAQYADYRAVVREVETTAGLTGSVGMGIGVGMGSSLSPRSSIQRGNSVTSSTVRLPGDQISEHKQRAVHSGLLKLAKEASGAQGMFKLDSEDWVNRFTMMLFKESSSVRFNQPQLLLMLLLLLLLILLLLLLLILRSCSCSFSCSCSCFCSCSSSGGGSRSSDCGCGCSGGGEPRV